MHQKNSKNTGVREPSGEEMLAARVYNKSNLPVTQVFVLGDGRDILNKGLCNKIHTWEKKTVQQVRRL